MNGWITFWTIVCAAGFISFYLSVLVIIPLGARDLFALLRRLGAERTSDKDERTE